MELDFTWMTNIKDDRAKRDFNPAFAEFATDYIATQIQTALSNGTEILGFFTDNELPVVSNMLTNYLTLH